MKDIIVYFSWSNNTKRLVEAINQELKDDVVRIERKNPYSTDYNQCAYVEAKEEERKRFREKQQEAIKSRGETVHEEEPTEDLFVKEGDDEEEVEASVESTPIVEETPVVPEEKTEEKVENDEVIAEEEPVVETKKVKEEEPVEFKEVKTTTTLESLERSLEEEKKEKSSSKKTFKKKKKEVKKDNEDDEEKEDKKVIQKMDIYTDEELEAFENEDSDEDFEDEEDYSEYDDDDYYEDR